MKFSATFVTLCLIAVRVQAHKLPSLYSLQRRGDQFVTGPCTQDSDCQQGCCGFTSGKCAGPAVAQTNGSGGCGFGTKTPNCNVAAALGLSDCIAGAKNGDLADPGVQAAAAFAAKLDNLPFTPATASTAAPPAAADPASTAAAPPPAAADSGDLQQSLTVDSSVLQTTDNGQNPPVAGQAAAQTSKNNFINFCVPTLKTLPITNGLQVTTGSCNPTPIGQIPSVANIPSAKFQSPTNGATLKANTPFNITLQAKNIELGKFTNAAKTYFANPQTLNAQGQIIGHTHIVIEAVDSLDSTKVSDATKFLFFKGINDGADAQGNVQAVVAAGLPVGTYRMGTIMSSATHQPVIVAVAQHGLTDDVIYMTVTADGTAAAAAPPATAAPPAAAPPAAAPPAAAAAGAPANGGPAFDPAGVPHVGNGAGAQFIGGQCLSAADCGSGCCAGPSGICSGPGAATQAGKTGCGFVAPGKRAFGL